MKEDKNIMNWSSLDQFTNNFKEWILKLFRRAHARMGHIEEELAKLRNSVKAIYSLEKKTDSDGNFIVTLVDKATGEEHGSFSVSSNGSPMSLTWEEDGEGRPQR